MRLVSTLLAALCALAFVLFVPSAHADELPPDPSSERCTVNLKCSSTGVACLAGDRACTNDATSRGLEIICEDKRHPPDKLVYCPPDTGHAESKIVWVLLAAAAVLAIGGSALAWLVLRKKA